MPKPNNYVYLAALAGAVVLTGAAAFLKLVPVQVFGTVLTIAIGAVVPSPLSPGAVQSVTVQPAAQATGAPLPEKVETLPAKPEKTVLTTSGEGLPYQIIDRRTPDNG